MHSGVQYCVKKLWICFCKNPEGSVCREMCLTSEPCHSHRLPSARKESSQMPFLVISIWFQLFTLQASNHLCGSGFLRGRKQGGLGLCPPWALHVLPQDSALRLPEGPLGWEVCSFPTSLSQKLLQHLNAISVGGGFSQSVQLQDLLALLHWTWGVCQRLPLKSLQFRLSLWSVCVLGMAQHHCTGWSKLPLLGLCRSRRPEFRQLSLVAELQYQNAAFDHEIINIKNILSEKEMLISSSCYSLNLALPNWGSCWQQLLGSIMLNFIMNCTPWCKCVPVVLCRGEILSLVKTKRFSLMFCFLTQSLMSGHRLWM